VLASVVYVRDPSGEPRRITREDGSYVEIDYDAAWRVDEERYFAAGGALLETITYGYDLDGNRTVRTSSSAGAETYGYANGFEHTSTTGPGGSASYGYDLGGRLTTIGRPGLSASLAYDSDDHLTVATVSGLGTFTYGYDGAGRRTSSSNGSAFRRYLTAPVLGDGLDSPQQVADASGVVAATYVYAGEQPVLRIDGAGDPVYYLTDPMGSVLALADEAGAQVAQFHYDAFGRERSATGSQAALPAGTGGDFRYHGQWQDVGTGLYHVRARTYDAPTGRFTSRDPVEGVVQQPETFHPYTWNANNPHVYRDPSGMFSLTEISVANGIQNVLVTTARSALINYFRDYAKDKAMGVAGKILMGFVESALPWDTDVFDDLAGAIGGDGNFFEKLVLQNVCDYLPEDMRDLVYAFPRIDSSSGKPVTNGISCHDIDMGLGDPGGDDASIDLVLSKLQLTGSESVAAGDGKAYLPIEIKVSSKAFKDKFKGKTGSQGQLGSILNITKNYVYPRTALLVALRGDASNSGWVARKLKRVMLDERILVQYLTLTGK
jgi:RHS repeat-associated protein